MNTALVKSQGWYLLENMDILLCPIALKAVIK